MFLFALVYCYSFRPRQIELENEGSFNESSGGFSLPQLTRTDLVLSRLYSAATSSFVFFSLKLAVDQVVMVDVYCLWQGRLKCPSAGSL